MKKKKKNSGGTVIFLNDNMQRHVSRFIDDHEGFTTSIPKWYRRS